MKAVGWAILILAVILILIWLSRSASAQEFVGLAPLIPGHQSARYLGDVSHGNEFRRALAAQNAAAIVAGAAADGAAESLVEESLSAISPEAPVENSEISATPSEDLPAEENRGKNRKTSGDAGGNRLGEVRVTERISGGRDHDGEVTNEETVSLDTPRPFAGTASSRKEEECRRVLQQIYSPHTFPKVRPSWMRNPVTGKPLEMDGYCHPLRLGFEFNGAQHYDYPNAFHKNRDEFLSQLRRDATKYHACKRLGIHLIVIPHTVPLDQLQEFIELQLPAKIRRPLYVSPK